MAKFYLIDQSFKEEGSHHADYVRCIAWAAKDAGYEVVIGANRCLSKKWCKWMSDVSRFATIQPAFRHTTYQSVSGLAGMQRMKRSANRFLEGKSTGFARLISRIRKYRTNRVRDSIIQQFARNCQTFFQHVPLSPQDHVFFASVSELELIGLANYLARNPHTLPVQWHVQFHFNLFDGRPPEYERQSDTLLEVRSSLSKALSPVVYHNLNLFTTTEELADQYNQLGVGYFQPLAYPIAKEFAPDYSRATVDSNTSSDLQLILTMKREQGDSILRSYSSGQIRSSYLDQSIFSTESTDTISVGHPTLLSENLIGGENSLSGEHRPRPLKVVCPGSVRREKGQQDFFQPLIDQVFEKLIAPRRIELVAQTSARKIGERNKLAVTPPAGLEVGLENLITTVPHPLPRWDYCELIRSADIGLLFYDSRAYYSRRAGILGELLSAGKPVIVPAGSWLAEQIAESGFRHVENTFARSPYRVLGLSEFSWDRSNVPMHGGVINFDDGRRPFQFELPLQKNDGRIALRFDWQWPQERGIYCRVEVEQFSNERLIQKTCQVVGHRSSQYGEHPARKPIAMFPVAPSTDRVRFRLKNAFHHSSASLRNLHLWIASEPEESQRASIPISAVGVIASDRAQLGESLIEIVTHYEHYQRTAKHFSPQWYAQHNPYRTIQQLTSNDSLATEVA